MDKLRRTATDEKGPVKAWHQRDRREWNPETPDLDYPLKHNLLWSFINDVGQKLNKLRAKIGEDLATCLLYR